ncbi:MAG TPA: hypothetical protein VM223_08105, partial [Planctomycetota bacterium]|nr:hypothetical protein [Planctomycetota bacterium]
MSTKTGILGFVALCLMLMACFTPSASALEITGVTVGGWTHIDTPEDERYLEAVNGEDVLFWGADSGGGTALRRATYSWDGSTLTVGTPSTPSGLTYVGGTSLTHNVYREPSILKSGDGTLHAYFQPRGGTSNGVFHAVSTDNGATWVLDAPLPNFLATTGESLDGSIILPYPSPEPVYNPYDVYGGSQTGGVCWITEAYGERRLYTLNQYGDMMLFSCAEGANGPFTNRGVLIDNHTSGSPVIETLPGSGDAVRLLTGQVVGLYVDGAFWKPWDNEANEGAVGLLLLDPNGVDFTQQLHDVVRVDDAALQAAGLTALEEATITNISLVGNRMTCLLMLIGANDDPA